MAPHLLAIDQGTTSTRAVVFDDRLTPKGSAHEEVRQIYPAPGQVEHDAQEIWEAVVRTVRTALTRAGINARQVAAVGITNQRETTVLWSRETGRPVHNAIVWQDRRTSERCAALRQAGNEDFVAERTGLLLDPYFSATKLEWLLGSVPGAREAAHAGRLAFGTIDSFLLWHLTGGRVHATDATNASRTLLFNLRTGDWDRELLDFFGIPAALLPQVRDCCGDFGTTPADLFGGRLRIRGMAGDQQAATVGQGCFRPGMMKSTYGTGCFALLNTGPDPVRSKNRLLSTIAYQLEGRRTYALEGAIFIAGAAVQWLRDALKVITDAAETSRLAASANPSEQVYLVPAYVGLGAPWWDADARGAMFGLTRNSGREEFARAALEAVGYQTRDLLEAMAADWPASSKAETVLRVDGGLSASDWAMQFLADILAAPVDRPVVMETTALGAAYLAGRSAGICPDLDGFAATWRLETRFQPRMDAATRRRKWAGWRDAVARTLSGARRSG
jgi:glycerol kinase